MKKINEKEFEELRVYYHDIIKDEKTTMDELVLMFEFFREHMYVVDNEIKRRAWIDFKAEEDEKINKKLKEEMHK